MGISPDLSSQETRHQYRHIHAERTSSFCPCLKVQPAPPVGTSGSRGCAQDSSSSHHPTPGQGCYAQFRDNNSSSKASALQLAQEVLIQFSLDAKCWKGTLQLLYCAYTVLARALVLAWLLLHYSCWHWSSVLNTCLHPSQHSCCSQHFQGKPHCSSLPAVIVQTQRQRLLSGESFVPQHGILAMAQQQCLTRHGNASELFHLPADRNDLRVMVDLHSLHHYKDSCLTGNLSGTSERMQSLEESCFQSKTIPKIPTSSQTIEVWHHLSQSNQLYLSMLTRKSHDERQLLSYTAEENEIQRKALLLTSRWFPHDKFSQKIN